ncbi:hypothetical protein SAMN05216413_1755 [Ruminococcaceae bacterium KH2T8]|nr:hypothetical protein SAMN05216413_1755 [Ruminococcaceae bacterium KH2T8]SMC61357.1 hypothetical protein SAMN06296952_1941 [Oscillospiraceae bacterium]
MNYIDLNKFIKRYATQSKTKTAMLLTGDWGSGKSYYISNILCPYLKKRKVKCIVVSLYGVDNLTELSKRIYLRLRLPTFSKKSEAKEYVSIIGHSIIDNALSLKGVNVGVSDNQLVKLYESVNLKDVLIIFEDTERSSIDILMLLGYINGLVEYDGAKALIVANEKEILGQNHESFDYDFSKVLTTQTDEIDETAKDEKQYLYLRMKEKTIGDTVQFTADIIESVKSIINDYSGNWISSILRDDEIEKIAGIVRTRCNNNLRILIYALQKCDDIFSALDIERSFEDAFYQVTLEGALIFSKRFLCSDTPGWEGTNCISVQLGESRAPLFRFVYDYLLFNTYRVEDIIAASVEYSDYCCFEKNATRDKDSDLFVLENYHIQKEADVKTALENIYKKLKKTNYLGVHAYEHLALKVIRAGMVIGFDVEPICSQMISNTKKMCRVHPSSSQEIIWGLITKISDDKDVMSKYEKFMKRFAEAIDNSNSNIVFSYDPDDIEDFYHVVLKNKHIYMTRRRFMCDLDNRKIVSMLTDCTAEQISDFRSILISVYDRAMQDTYDESDKKALKDLLDKLNKISPAGSNWDKIQWMQINYLKDNITDFISKI